MRKKPHTLRRWMTLVLSLAMLLSLALPARAATGDETAAPLLTCLPTTQWAEGRAITSPAQQGDVQYHATSLMVGNLDGVGLPELTWTGQMKLFLPDVTSVKLSLVHYGQPVTVVTYDDEDQELSRATTGSAEGVAHSIEWSGSTPVRKVMLLPGDGRYGLSSLCYSTANSVAKGEPDLTTWVNAPARARQGQAIEVTVGVRNLGNAVASGTQAGGEKGYRAELVISKDTQVPIAPGQATAEYKEDTMLKRIAPTSDVSPGAAVEYKGTVQIPENTPPGVYYIAAVVDTFGVVSEANELNNVTLDAIIVEPKDAPAPNTQGLKWADFQNEKFGTRPAEFTLGLAKFVTAGGTKVIDLNADGYGDLLFSRKLEVAIPESSRVSATVTHYGEAVTMEARKDGAVVGTKRTTGADGAAEVLTIDYEAIDTVVFTVPTGSTGSLAKLGFQAPDVSDLACDPRVCSLAGGYGHSVAILKDGTVWAWGLNVSGQLGDNTQSNRFEPAQVKNLRNAVAVAAGRDHSLALLADGTVWSWGSNTSKQLGDGDSFDRWTPVQVKGLSDVVAITAGARFNLALKADGTVWGWGQNSQGQVGDGSTDQRSTPVQVKGLTDVKVIASGANHSLAIKKDGTLWAWGSNQHGQLGDGSTTDRTTPVQIKSMTDVVQVAGGLDHSLALKRDGSVWSWGQNDHGQLGDGTTTRRSSPKQIAGLQAVHSIASGEATSFAVRQDGTIWGWGYNASNQMADGGKTDRPVPAQINGISGVVKVATGHASHVLALTDAGRLWTWGNNTSGQTSNLFSTTTIAQPSQIELKQGLLFCPLQQLPVEEQPEAPKNPADDWKCTTAAFKDVAANHPACGAISMLVDAGVVNGYADGSFKPEDPINRAAMAKLLVAALKLQPTPQEKVNFNDTTGHWAVAQGWLQVAVANNIVGGYPDKTFKPDVEVNRAAALRMAAGALNIPRADGKPIPEMQPPYKPATAHLTDVLEGVWYYDWVVLSLRADLIGPEAPFPIFTESKLDPEKVLTRGEAAIIVANLLFFRER